VSLSLKSNSVEGTFKWQDWIDAAMGYMKGWNERDDGGEVKYEWTIVRVDLREPMVEVFPLRIDDEGNVEKTGVAQIWQGWPVFDTSICKFEVEQWLSACDIDLNAIENLNDETIVDIEVERAERLLKVFVLERD